MEDYGRFHVLTGGPGSGKTALIEALHQAGYADRRRVPQIFLIIEWPSQEAAKAFYESEEYRPYRQHRIAGAKNEFLLVAGEDMTGMAHIDG